MIIVQFFNDFIIMKTNLIIVKRLFGRLRTISDTSKIKIQYYYYYLPINYYSVLKNIQ